MPSLEQLPGMGEAPSAAQPWRGPTISRSLQVLAVAVLLLIVGFTVQQLWQTRASLLNATFSQMARLDMVFAEQTGRAVETVDLVMRNAAESLRALEAVHPVSRAEGDDLLRRRIDGVRQVQDIGITDASGAMQYASHGAVEAPLPPAGMTLLEYHRTHPGPELQISEPIRDAGGHWTTLLSRRLPSDDGSFQGIIVAWLNMLYFQDFYQAVELSENGAIVLHRRDGTVLARYPPSDKLIGTSFAELPPFRDVLSKQIAGTVLMTSPVDGSHRVLAIRALKAFPLAVNVSVDEGAVMAPWRRQAWTFGIGALLVCVVTAALLLLLAQRSRQIDRALSEIRTARDDAEAANLRLRQEIDERARAEAALQQAQRIEAVGQLTGGVAHDFNNLLTVVLGNIDLLLHRIADQSVIDRLEVIRGAAERGATLTGQLLAFARRQPLQPRPVDLDRLIGGMRDLLQSAIGSPVRLVTDLRGGPRRALVDPTQIELVVLNLAINARDSMAAGGVLTIETAPVELGAPSRPEQPPAGRYAMIRVTDTGSGMPPDVLARVFEPFFTTKPTGAGSGLGLSQVYGLARQSGGGIRIDSHRWPRHHRAYLLAARRAGSGGARDGGGSACRCHRLRFGVAGRRRRRGARHHRRHFAPTRLPGARRGRRRRGAWGAGRGPRYRRPADRRGDAADDRS